MTFPAPTDTSEQLITANYMLAVDAANKWHAKTGQPFDDLLQVACLGLMKGCRKYDPNLINPKNGQPYKLSTIAVPFINGEILHWFRDSGYTIKFPHQWREKWGLIQRLMNDPAVSAHEIAERAGLRGGITELAEMLAAMRSTTVLEDVDVATPAQEIELSPLNTLHTLIRNAWDKLTPADQRMLCGWWEDQRRNAYPTGPMQQFHLRVKLLLGGKTMANLYRTPLGFDIEQITPAPRQPRQRRIRAAGGDQLGLVLAN